MNEPIENNSTPWTQMKSRVVGLTAVLIVLPSLINAGNDVYEALFNKPKTDRERTSNELFAKYFNKQPISQNSHEIKNGPGTIDVRFEIYEEGEVLVQYGKVTHWFPLPKADPHTTAGLSLLSSAFAAEDSGPRGVGNYTQTDSREGGILVRVRVYENGVIETLRIDPRTGQILDRKAVQG